MQPMSYFCAACSTAVNWILFQPEELKPQKVFVYFSPLLQSSQKPHLFKRSITQYLCGRGLTDSDFSVTLISKNVYFLGEKGQPG